MSYAQLDGSIVWYYLCRYPVLSVQKNPLTSTYSSGMIDGVSDRGSKALYKVGQGKDNSSHEAAIFAAFVWLYIEVKMSSAHFWCSK